MRVTEIESLPEVQASARVLAELETRGINEAAIAGGWTRTLVAGGDTKDIDISYIGSVHYEDAQGILAQVLEEINPPNRALWDVKGIWNAELADGIKHTVDNFLLYYLNSIDSIYLASDGKLHDPTGHGFLDAKMKVLRMNNYDIRKGAITASKEVYVCLENCRRMAKFGWTPTARTVERITGSVPRWSELSKDEMDYFVLRLRTKYSDQDRQSARAVYDVYGWGFVYDL